MNSKLGVFIMTQKGYYSLHAFVKNGFASVIDVVVVGEDAKLDNDYKSAIISLCKSNEIGYCNRKDFDENKYNFDYALAISWRWMLNLKAKTIVIHDSLLPKYRGFAPLVSQLINGETEIGASMLFAANNYDEGNIIAQSKIQISYPIKIAEAIEKLVDCYAELCLTLVKTINSGESIKSIPQNHDNATYSLWRDSKDYFIDWNMDAPRIKRFIDAVGSPYEGAKSYLNKDIIQINEAEVYDDVFIENRNVGKVIFMDSKYPVVVCGSGLLKIKSIITARTKQDLIPLKQFRSRFH